MNWLLMYLGDEDCVRVLDRARQALAPQGVLVVKDNVRPGLLRVCAARCTIVETLVRFGVFR